jgi:phosphate transport system substrate-binding protein
LEHNSVKTSSKRLAATAIVAALALAACGGDDDDPAANDTASAPAASDTSSAETTPAETTPASDTASAPASGTAPEVTTPPSSAPAGEIDYGSLSGTLVGAGSSAQAAAMDGWKAGFAEVAPNVTIEYDPVGSGGGREAFLSGGALFAGSDSPLNEEEYTQSLERCAGDQGAINLPHYISPIAVAYNLPAIEGTTLQLSATTVAGIFANTISNWNDAAIAADNPDVTLPDLAINPVHRSDESGTSKNFTDYLSKAAPDVWSYGAIEVWDEGPGGGEGADGTSGVVAAVEAGEGSIGYADFSQINTLPAAAIGVADGFVEISAESAAKIIDSSPRVEGTNPYDYAIEVNRTPDTADTYPIALVSYHIVCLQYDDPAEAAAVQGFMAWVGSADGQAAAAATAGSAPISDAVSAAIAESVAQISAG